MASLNFDVPDDSVAVVRLSFNKKTDPKQ
jgi:hypothetical protein